MTTWFPPVEQKVEEPLGGGAFQEVVCPGESLGHNYD